MNPVSGVAHSPFNGSQLTERLADLKQKYNDLSPEEQNSVQNKALDKKNQVVEPRQENKDQLRSAAVGVYSNQLAKDNAELFLSQSFGQDVEAGQDITPSAAADVYKSVQRSAFVNSDVFQNNINDVVDNRNQPPAPPVAAPVEPEEPAPDDSNQSSPGINTVV